MERIRLRQWYMRLYIFFILLRGRFWCLVDVVFFLSTFDSLLNWGPVFLTDVHDQPKYSSVTERSTCKYTQHFQVEEHGHASTTNGRFFFLPSNDSSISNLYHSHCYSQPANVSFIAFYGIQVFRNHKHADKQTNTQMDKGFGHDVSIIEWCRSSQRGQPTCKKLSIKICPYTY